MVPVLMNLFNMTVFKTKIKVKRAKLMFLPVVSSIPFFVFAGCKIMALLSHQSDASFMLLCSSFGTVSVFLSDVFSEVSSANMLQLTLLVVSNKQGQIIDKN